MTLSYLPRRLSFILPALAFAPFLLGADGQGCGPGAPFGTGHADSGTTPPDASSVSCTAADCQGLAPVLLCPSDATSESSCVAQADGDCGWSSPVCVVVDAGHADACTGVALPCAACPYGSTGTATDANGCDTCPICAPPPDAGVICGCPAIIVAKCPDGSSPPMTTGPAPCFCPESGPCPADAGTTSCTSDGDCPTGSACGFPEAEACMVITGECFALPGVECNAISLGCACDGTEVNVACNGLPSGYAPKPLRHTGACTDAG